jgi:hypothetical protein
LSDLLHHRFIAPGGVPGSAVAPAWHELAF